MKNYLKISGLALIALVGMMSCSKNDDAAMEGESYNTSFEVTDAPIDNAEVEAVFVTIANVSVDGKSLEGFTATTINLAALVNGKTEALGNLDLQAKSYSSIVFELDFDKDVNGDAPGCYVEKANGEKDALMASSNKITITDKFEVLANATNVIVIDFDLRKTIKEEKDGLSSDFNFVTMAELTAGIRTVNAELTGKISGSVNDANNTSDKIIVYAYEKGTFNADVETQGKGESEVTFANAVTSTEVKNLSGSYSLDFLEEGEYELIFASYKEDDNSEFYFNALLNVESTTGLNLGAIEINSAIQISANVTVTGTK
ncbi:DUF4382 domain-containing protein [Arenibacter algicola]|uniref:DUF4382 domain-containing protein n=1 Tax=Arenibacter algicola TaxID=616991 RepID=A0A221UT01_9FLAO|nr:DUF4382 domain-containing protein [Arenibacter algicola]ASO04474.1 hypothetical protein AREALGSMS7_00998 [Arenibacter algicola]HCO83667.1 DUF4382 domain-containing protein [Arenibacter sp.]|tara:strand:+ start:62 stop:1009 length:948 start_codon:yes stop_codon:yes gene_type:complete